MARNRRHPISRLLAIHDRTVQDLAKHMGVSQSTIYSWTSGNRTPNQRSLAKMVRWFTGLGLHSSDYISGMLLGERE